MNSFIVNVCLSSKAILVFLHELIRTSYLSISMSGNVALDVDRLKVDRHQLIGDVKDL